MERETASNRIGAWIKTTSVVTLLQSNRSSGTLAGQRVGGLDQICRHRSEGGLRKGASVMLFNHKMLLVMSTTD